MSRQASGLQAWFVQRMSALYLTVFLLYFFAQLLIHGSFSAHDWQAWFAQPLMSLATGLFFISLLLHAWIGVRDVIIDYIHPISVRVLLLSLVVLILSGCGIWILKILLSQGAG